MPKIDRVESTWWGPGLVQATHPFDAGVIIDLIALGFSTIFSLLPLLESLKLPLPLAMKAGGGGFPL